MSLLSPQRVGYTRLKQAALSDSRALTHAALLRRYPLAFFQIKGVDHLSWKVSKAFSPNTLSTADSTCSTRPDTSPVNSLHVTGESLQAW